MAGGHDAGVLGCWVSSRPVLLDPTIWLFPKNRGPILGVPIIRIIDDHSVFGSIWKPLRFGNPHILRYRTDRKRLGFVGWTLHVRAKEI